jgi:O-antigen ligase
MKQHPSTYRRSSEAWALPAVGNLELAWFFLLLGTLSFTDTTAAVALSGQLNTSNILRYACVVLALMLIAPELRAPIRFRFDPLWLFVAYTFVCISSTLWSFSPIVTLGKGVELAAATATVVFAANRGPDGRALMRLFNLTFAFGAAMLVVVAVGYVFDLPGFSVQTKGLISRQLDTWFLGANGVGYVSALSATLALNGIFRRTKARNLMWGLYALSLTTAILAQGRTGLLALLLGSLLVLAIHRRFKTLLVCCALLLLATVSFSQTIADYLVRGELAENLQTLSGRTVMWHAGWQSFLDNPLAGRGFGVGGRSLFLTSLAGFGVQLSSLHSGFLELLTGVGLFGFIPWIVSLGWTLIHAFRSGLLGKNAGVCALMIPLLTMTVMSTGAGGWFDLSLGYFLCCTAILAHGAALAKRRPSAA